MEAGIGAREQQVEQAQLNIQTESVSQQDIEAYELSVATEVAKLPDRKRSQLRNKRFGFVFQIYNLLPRLTAVENVMIPLIYGGVVKRERRPRAEASLETVRLKERMSHRPGELSGGRA